MHGMADHLSRDNTREVSAEEVVSRWHHLFQRAADLLERNGPIAKSDLLDISHQHLLQSVLELYNNQGLHDVFAA